VFQYGDERIVYAAELLLVDNTCKSFYFELEPMTDAYLPVLPVGKGSLSCKDVSLGVAHHPFNDMPYEDGRSGRHSQVE
jgi:hypothetical protein